MKNQRGQVAPGVMLAALAVVGMVYGVQAVGHGVKVAAKQTVCFVRTLHRCPKPPVQTQPQIP